MAPAAGTKWSDDEVAALARSWITVREDVQRVGSDEDFWASVQEHFEAARDSTPARSAGAMMARWEIVAPEIARFHEVFKRVVAMPVPGFRENDYVQKAHEKFMESNLHGEEFPHFKAWQLLRRCRMWNKDGIGGAVSFEDAEGQVPLSPVEVKRPVQESEKAILARLRTTLDDDEDGEGGEDEKHVVWVGRVPSGLCAREQAVRTLFEDCGTLLSVKIHHNFEDMSSEGFMFLTFASRKDAKRAIAAVQSGTLGQDDSENQNSSSQPYEFMRARLALKRGGEPALDADEDVADLLLGRRQANLANPFSQRSATEDEDDLVLQSLSQGVAFGNNSQSKKKKKTKKGKKVKRRRANSFLSVADE